MKYDKTKRDFPSTLMLVLVMFFVLFWAGCGQKPMAPSGPNIILITIDTLRADHLFCYGYSRQTSPFIDNIARQSAVFTQAYSTSSWTAPSMASIFTGLYPRSHGVQHGVARGPKAFITGQEMLVKKIPTIAAVLKAAGYATFGVSSNAHVSVGTGFAQGFDYFETHWFMKSPAPNNSVKKWLKHIRQAHRYFLWVHYFDPHNPYGPRRPWFKTYMLQSNSYSQWTRKVMPNPKDHIKEIRGNPEALQTLVDRYDSEINFCDRHINELFDLLSPDENTLIIITVDHGEAFLDHGQLLHGDTLFEEEIRVPLLIKLPGSGHTKKTIPLPLSNRHIFRTIMDIAGLDKGNKIPGISLMPLISEAATVISRHVYFELDWSGYSKALRVDNWKLVVSGRDRKKHFLFNLQSDPGEARNLAGKMPEKAKELEALLKHWMKSNPEFKAPKIRVAIDKEHENKLRTLGYL